jgi:hypothetical protein
VSVRDRDSTCGTGDVDREGCDFLDEGPLPRFALKDTPGKRFGVMI